MTQQMSGFNLHSGRVNRRQVVGASALAAASLGAMRVPRVGAQGVEVTWTSWGNTGEVANLREFTEAYNASQSDVVAVYTRSRPTATTPSC